MVAIYGTVHPQKGLVAWGRRGSLSCLCWLELVFIYIYLCGLPRQSWKRIHVSIVVMICVNIEVKIARSEELPNIDSFKAHNSNSRGYQASISYVSYIFVEVWQSCCVWSHSVGNCGNQKHTIMTWCLADPNLGHTHLCHDFQSSHEYFVHYQSGDSLYTLFVQQ